MQCGGAGRGRASIFMTIAISLKMLILLTSREYVGLGQESIDIPEHIRPSIILQNYNYEVKLRARLGETSGTMTLFCVSIQ